MTYSITQLFNDPKLDDMIRNMSYYRNEYKQAKSELFFILCEGGKVEGLACYDEQIFYCSRILKNTLHSNTNPYWKNFHNSGRPKSQRVVELSSNEFLIPDDNILDNFDIDKHSSDIDSMLTSEHFYYLSLFNLYRSGMTYTEISKHTGIKYQSVRLAVLRVKNKLTKTIYEKNNKRGTQSIPC